MIKKNPGFQGFPNLTNILYIIIVISQGKIVSILEKFCNNVNKNININCIWHYNYKITILIFMAILISFFLSFFKC